MGKISEIIMKKEMQDVDLRNILSDNRLDFQTGGRRYIIQNTSNGLMVRVYERNEDYEAQPDWIFLGSKRVNFISNLE